MIKRTFGIILVFTLLTSAIVLFFLNSSSGVSMAPASCNAEYLNQIYDVNAFDKGKTFYTACTVGNNVTTNSTCYGVNYSNIDSFTVPLNYPYGKVSIINASILARCTPLNISFFCPYFINGHLCGAFGSGNITAVFTMEQTKEIADNLLKYKVLPGPLLDLLDQKISEFIEATL